MSTRADRLMKNFDRRRSHFRRAIVHVTGAGEADDVLREARDVFASMADEIPYADDEKNVLASQIIGPAQLLACALVLRRRGYSSQQIGALIGQSVQQTADRLRFIPGWLVRGIAWLGGPLIRRAFRKQAEASRGNPDPRAFAFDVVDDVEADFGFDMKRCAVCTLYERHDEMEIVPYVCEADDRLSDAVGLGLRRTGTRGLGAPHCDFRYRPGGEAKRVRDLEIFP